MRRSTLIVSLATILGGCSEFETSVARPGELAFTIGSDTITVAETTFVSVSGFDEDGNPISNPRARVVSLDTSVLHIRPLPSGGYAVWGMRPGLGIIRVAFDPSTGLEGGNFLDSILVMERWKDLAVGGEESCALRSTGTWYCWGLVSLAPERITVPTRMSQVGSDQVRLFIGSGRTCAVRVTQTALCWGFGSRGNMGAGFEAGQTLPIGFGGTLPVATMSLGEDHTCSISPFGGMWCSGSNSHGQLGTASGSLCNASSTSPTPCSLVPLSVDTPAEFTAVGVSRNFTCGVTTVNAVLCWGDNEFFQIGDGNFSTGTPVGRSLGIGFTAIALSLESACALSVQGDAYCWGWNGYGGLGNPLPPDRCSVANIPCARTPVRAESGGFRFSDITAGAEHTCALTEAGEVLCWGDGASGQIGTDRPTNGCFGNCAIVPMQVAGNKRFVRIMAGDAHTCGLTMAGAVYCWGDNLWGQLGNGISGNGAQGGVLSRVPVRVVDPNDNPS